MAQVVSVSVPENLHTRWKESGKDISPSALFQTALETELDNTNRHLVYWSKRALEAEKKLEMIRLMLEANEKEVKKFLYFEKEQQG
jgi:post-segregation antitoxin (ccd killing protein)|tara:strand:+ start:20 stop:277 length:258 start_codon:yes stop_codon:yes gene_type:complete